MSVNASQLNTLRTIDRFRLVRDNGGWRCAGSPLVTLANASRLQRDGYAIARLYNGRWRLETTVKGKLEIAAADMRRKRA